MFAIAIHGGAGIISRKSLTEGEEKLYLQGLEKSLDAGYAILDKGGRALEAVEAAVISLEDNELFNAGKGSVFTSDGTHEMEASIMWGKTLQSGAVCGVRNVKNPVILARAILERAGHAFLCGKGAERFALKMGLQFEDDDYFFTQKRHEQLLEAKKTSRTQLDHYTDDRLGTVGAVAVDNMGNLASATSTGGITNKNYGRIGDSPVIGAGTYANNRTCAVSCTGDGEYFIRSVVAYDVSCLLEYKEYTLKEACQLAVQKLSCIGGTGGLIAIDRTGNVEFAFNTPGMYRGLRKQNKSASVAIFA